MRTEGVANPHGHFRFRSERQHVRMKNFGTAGGEGMSFIIAQVMKEPGFGRVVRIGSVNAVHVGPDDEFCGVEDVGDEGAGVVGTVAAESGDAAVGSGADEAGDDGDEPGVEQGEKNGATALFGLFEVRLGVAEGVAGKDEIGGSDGNGGDAGCFEGGGKEAGAETFAEGSEAIGKLGAGGDATVERDFVEQVASKKLEAAADAVMHFFFEVKILEDVQMKM